MNYTKLLKIGILTTTMCMAAGCSNPDPDGAYAAFGSRTEEDRQTPDNGLPEDGVQVDFSGDYFLSLKTLIGPTTPFYLLMTVSVDENFVADFSLQPLKSDLDPKNGKAPRPDARTPIGEPLVHNGVQMREDGTWDLEFIDAIFPDEANPISGAQIRADIFLFGITRGPQSNCGIADGQAYEPLAIPLKKSQFGTVWVDTDDLTTITPILTCEGDAINNVNNATDMGDDMTDMGDDMTDMGDDMADMGDDMADMPTDMTDMSDADM